MKLDHHLFCTQNCHGDFLAASAGNHTSHYARYALYAGAGLLVAGLVYFALLADAFYNGDQNGAQPELNELSPSLPVQTAEKNEEIAIEKPLNGMKSASQIISVDGQAPQNSVVALYLNGTLVESTVARQAVYHFPQVVLTKHANVLQTKFYGDGGASNSSTAIMVFYQDAIRSHQEDSGFFQNSSDNISRGNLSRQELVLTFDGGSEANSCEQILNTLDKYGIHSTIFLTGEFIERFPELTRKIAQKHEVGNHTYSHDHLTTYAENSRQNTFPGMTREELHNQLQKTEEVFYHTTGKRMAPLWRAPYGEHNLEIRKWGAELGYVHVAWTSNPKTRQNMDSLDWVPNSSTPGYFPAMLIKDRLLSFGQNEPDRANGSIILMHLGTQRSAQDRVDKWLPEIIQTFRERGYKFITASELIDHQDLLPNTNIAMNQS